MRIIERYRNILYHTIFDNKHSFIKSYFLLPNCHLIQSNLLFGRSMPNGKMVKNEVVVNVFEMDFRCIKYRIFIHLISVIIEEMQINFMYTLCFCLFSVSFLRHLIFISS